MKSALVSINSSRPFAPLPAHTSSKPKIPNIYLAKSFTLPTITSLASKSKPSRLVSFCGPPAAGTSDAQLKDRGLAEVSSEDFVDDENAQSRWNVQVGSPSVPANVVPGAKLSLSDQAFFLLAFIACTVGEIFGFEDDMLLFKLVALNIFGVFLFA